MTLRGLGGLWSCNDGMVDEKGYPKQQEDVSDHCIALLDKKKKVHKMMQYEINMTQYKNKHRYT
jgi:hypothetical protein